MCKRSTIFCTASPASLISSAVVHLPSEKRTAERARSTGKPIASKTCDATTEPTMHAEPLDAQTPSRSSAIKSISESSPSKLTFKVLASRGAPSPFCFAAGMFCEIRIHSSSRRRASRSCSRARSRCVHSAAAAAIPAIAATFSVPGRRSFSCAPPNMIGWMDNPLRRNRNPAPFGP